MPCDTIQTSTVELLHPNIKLLMDALTALGLNPVHHAESEKITFRGGNWTRGKITVKTSGYGESKTATDIKQAYSKQIVGYAAKQFGWKLNEAQASNKRGVAFQIKAKKGS